MSFLDRFEPQISVSEFSTKLFSLNKTKDQCFVPYFCLDEHHQGYAITHETTHVECLCIQRFDPMWGVPCVVCYMVSIMAHDFINNTKDPWPKPTNGINFT